MSTMTQTLAPVRSLPATRPRLVTGRFAAAMLADFGALTSFYLLLSVTPMYAVSAGAGSAGAGLVTGSLMLTTVLAEFASPRLLARFGYRAVFAAGVLLLGGPAPALLAPHSMATIIAVSIARGFGFGLCTVVLGALVAASVPAERRGEGIGLAGGVTCVPAIVALPSGVWLAQNTGYVVVIAITAISALAPLAAVPWLADPASQQVDAGSADPAPAGLLGSLRSGGMLRPGLVFAATTVSAGVVASFLPLAAGVSAGVATLGPFAQAVTATASRWWAGRRGDRHGRGDRGHVPVRDRVRDRPERHLRADDRPRPRLRLRHRQRPVEPGLRRRLRHRPHRVRRVRGAHRLSGRVRPHRAADPRRPAARGARPSAAGGGRQQVSSVRACSGL